jgi:hypothetical protein
MIDNEAFYGFRVRRTVNGKLYQEYFSLKKDGKRLGPRQLKQVQKVAEIRDGELYDEQVMWKQKKKAENCFQVDGSVKGISFLLKKEKSGNLTPIFQVGIASELDNKIICTSYSINAHGLKGAWDKAVATYTEHKNIKKNTKLFKQLASAMPKVDLPEAGDKASTAKAASKKSVVKKAAVKKAPAKKKAVVKKAAVKKAPAKKK